MKEFDLESLAAFNGQDGRPVYIAYGGKVYDVSASKLWQGGSHMGQHHAAGDLSAEFPSAPHGEEVFERYPQVGVLKERVALQRSMPAFLAVLLARFPMLERHPHPMTVHFPIVFFLSVPVFNFLYLITGMDSLEITALHCLIGGIMCAPVAMLTGLFTWWLNYLARPVRAVTLKIRLSGMLLVISSGVFLWRIIEPGIMHPPGITRIIYLIMTLSFIPLLISIGWLGASLTFPIKKR